METLKDSASKLVHLLRKYLHSITAWNKCSGGWRRSCSCAPGQSWAVFVHLAGFNFMCRLCSFLWQSKKETDKRAKRGPHLEGKSSSKRKVLLFSVVHVSFGRHPTFISVRKCVFVSSNHRLLRTNSKSHVIVASLASFASCDCGWGKAC